MGQKVHPYGFRVGYIYDWKSRWFAKKADFPGLLHDDLKIKKYIKKALATAAVSKIEIERTSERVRILIFSARPGIIIGRRGSEIEKLKEGIQGVAGKEIIIDIKEIKNANTDAQLVSENIAFQIEKRISHKRAMKKAVQAALDGGTYGVKIICAGRLGGTEMARSEWYREGRVPLHTLRADIDCGFSEAHTAYGLIGVKVLIFHGEVLPVRKEKEK